MTLLLAYALDLSSEMLNDFGYPCDAVRYREISEKLKSRTMDLCYSTEKGLISETPLKQEFSQHTNIFGILTNTIHPEDQKDVIKKILKDKSLIQTTLYFKFYLFQAMKKVGLGDEVLALIDEWNSFLKYGLTTFPEHGVNSRSDCHAWAAHPMYDFLNITCGIKPASPGFKTVEICPNPGSLSEFTGTVWHPSGKISVHYKKLKNERVEFEINLPGKLNGTLIFKNESIQLWGGKNHILK